MLFSLPVLGLGEGVPSPRADNRNLSSGPRSAFCAETPGRSANDNRRLFAAFTLTGTPAHNPAYVPASAHPQFANSRRRIWGYRMFCSLREQLGNSRSRLPTPKGVSGSEVGWADSKSVLPGTKVTDHLRRGMRLTLMPAQRAVLVRAFCPGGRVARSGALPSNT